MSEETTAVISFALLFLPAIIAIATWNIFNKAEKQKVKKSDLAEAKANHPVPPNEPSEYELQMRRDFNRYTQLREELKKIPMEDVNQWREDGRITDVQYDEICSAYNTLKAEMEEIRKRVRTINQTSAFREPEPPKRKEKRQKGKHRVSIAIAWLSSILLVLSVSLSGAYIYQLRIHQSDLEEDLLTCKRLYAAADINANDYKSKYTKLVAKYNDLSDSYDDLRVKYNAQYFEANSKLKIGDSKQTTINKCGSPDKMVERFKSWGSEDGWTFYYGTSYVLIDTNGKVEGWYVGDTMLPVE